MIHDLLMRNALTPGQSGVFVKPYVGNIITNSGYANISNIPYAFDNAPNTKVDMFGQYGGTSILRYTFNQVLPAGSKLTVRYGASASVSKTSYDILSVDESLNNKISLISNHNSGNTAEKILSCILPQDTKALDFQLDFIYFQYTFTEGMWIFDITVEL